MPNFKHYDDAKLNEYIDNKMQKEALSDSSKAIPEDASDTLSIGSLFANAEEANVGRQLAKQYLSEYNIETVSDKELLRQLIYLEVFHKCRLQKLANEATNQNLSPEKLISSIHDNLNQIIILKDKLGLSKSSKNTESVNDGYKALQLLKQKMKVWKQNNQASRTFACGHCGQMNLLIVKPEVWESQKHPFFKDRILGNTRLIQLYKEGKITQEDVGEILGVSKRDYCEWLINKWGKTETKDDTAN
jgi:hypothetical protein